MIGSSREKVHEGRAAASLSPMARNFPAVDSSSYKAVSLRISNSPCAAALKLRGQSVLENAAPQLPLSGCDRVCNCKYKSHDDRRIRLDRRSQEQVYVKVMGHAASSENRAGRDRSRKALLGC